MAEELSLDGIKDMKKAEYIKAFKNKAAWKKAKAVILLVDYKLEELLSGLKTFNPSDLDEIINPTKHVLNTDKIESIRAAMLAEKKVTFSVIGTIVLPNGQKASYTFAIPVVLEFTEKENNNAPFYKIKSDKVDYSDGSGGEDGVTLGENCKITQDKAGDVYLDLMVIGRYTTTEITNTIGNDTNIGISIHGLNYTIGNNNSTSESSSKQYSISKRFKINVLTQDHTLKGRILQPGKKQIDYINEEGEFIISSFSVKKLFGEERYGVNGINLVLEFNKQYKNNIYIIDFRK